MSYKTSNIDYYDIQYAADRTISLTYVCIFTYDKVIWVAFIGVIIFLAVITIGVIYKSLSQIFGHF